MAKKRGPKKTPAAVKKARKTYRADRDAGPAIETKPPSMPSWLGKEAKAEWKRLAPVLVKYGLLTEADRTTFGLYCQAYHDFLTAKRQVDKHGLTTTTEKGNVIQHPAVAVMTKAWARVLSAGAEFGLSPSARTGLPIEEPPAADEIADLLGD